MRAWKHVYSTWHYPFPLENNLCSMGAHHDGQTLQAFENSIPVGLRIPGWASPLGLHPPPPLVGTSAIFHAAYFLLFPVK
jgi:hypothetical protein